MRGEWVLCGLAVLMMATSSVRADELPADHGYVVMNVGTDWDTFENPKRARLDLSYVRRGSDATPRTLVVRPGDAVTLLTLPAGEYQWTALKVAGYLMQFEAGSGFTVSAGELTYAGDIDCELFLSRSGLEANIVIIDNQAETLEGVRAVHPDVVEFYRIGKRLMTLEPRVPATP